jgi:hypothetical protein
MKKTKLFIFVFLAVMVVGGMQPGLLYSGNFPGNPWDILIDPVSFTGTKWSGPLSVYYEFVDLTTCPGGEPYAKLYFTVRLSHQGVAPYAFYGTSLTPICRDDIYAQGDALRLFLNDTLSEIYGKPKNWSNGDWKLKSIQNATYWFDPDIGVDGAFVADITIAVK